MTAGQGAEPRLLPEGISPYSTQTQASACWDLSVQTASSSGTSLKCLICTVTTPMDPHIVSSTKGHRPRTALQPTCTRGVLDTVTTGNGVLLLGARGEGTVYETTDTVVPFIQGRYQMSGDCEKPRDRASSSTSSSHSKGARRHGPPRSPWKGQTRVSKKHREVCLHRARSRCHWLCCLKRTG